MFATEANEEGIATRTLEEVVDIIIPLAEDFNKLIENDAVFHWIECFEKHEGCFKE
jgi:hypothetical protein